MSVHVPSRSVVAWCRCALACHVRRVGTFAQQSRVSCAASLSFVTPRSSCLAPYVCVSWSFNLFVHSYDAPLHNLVLFFQSKSIIVRIRYCVCTRNGGVGVAASCPNVRMYACVVSIRPLRVRHMRCVSPRVLGSVRQPRGCVLCSTVSFTSYWAIPLWDHDGSRSPPNWCFGVVL